MRRYAAVVAAAVLSFLLAVPNIAEEANNPQNKQTPLPPPPTDNPQPKQDPGARKLSRRERKERIKNLGEKYQQFITDVEPIMQQSELDTFLILESDPQRDLYIDDFWHRRDVAQGTTNHAFRDLYYGRLEYSKEKFRNVSSDRSRIFLIHGEPGEVITSSCHLLQPLEIWKYPYINGMGHDIRFVFYVPRNAIDYRLWQPVTDDAVNELLSQELLGSSMGSESTAAQGIFSAVSRGAGMNHIQFECQNGDEIMKGIVASQINKYDLMKVFNPPPVNEEDVHKILRSVVISTPNAKQLTTEFGVIFPTKQGTRTDAQMTLLIPRSQLTLKDVSGVQLYSIDVTGEVLKEDQLYESYRYRFDYPGDMKADKVAVVLDRFLHPGDYKARIKISDLNANSESIIEKNVSVPEIFDTPKQRELKEQSTTTITALKDQIDANETSLRIVPLSEDLLSGYQHIDTIAFGAGIKAVEFYLDGKKVMTKRQPPFTLDLDFGSVPQSRKIRAVALDDKGQILTGDEIVVNTGNDPFRVRIVSPRVAVHVKGKTRVEMAVHVPDGKELDKLELYLNQTRVATLFGPPYVQTVDVPQQDGVSYFRAVATLKDDPTPPIEDLVMINTPQFIEELQVHLVELPTTVLKNGRPVNDVPEDAFKVLDDGKPVKVTKFDHVTNLPLSIGLAIDTSGSMQPRIAEAQKAASQFLLNVMRKGDKAFLVSFDIQPQLVQRWSPHVADVNAGLAKLRADESTALYDAVVYSLYNFLGVKGQKALVIITDGKDTSSKFSWDQAIEYARRAAVPIYGIGIGIGSSEVDVRYKFGRFCAETGGNVYYIDRAEDLHRIYTDIQNELRSQYILGFYPPDTVKPGSKWHEVTVQVVDGKAKTIRGYYP
jgi:Ca-activated chloride channel family protein